MQVKLTCAPGVLAHFVDLVRLDWRLFGAIILQLKLAAFVQSTAQICLPLGRVGFIYSLLVLPRLQSPCLGHTDQGITHI